MLIDSIVQGFKWSYGWISIELALIVLLLIFGSRHSTLSKIGNLVIGSWPFIYLNMGAGTVYFISESPEPTAPRFAISVASTVCNIIMDFSLLAIVIRISESNR